MVVRWQIWDPVTGDNLVFPVNPSEGSLPSQEKDFTTKQTTAPDGKAVMFEGQQTPLEMSFSGVIFDEADYDWFRTWYDKRYQVRLTDDLGNQFWVYLVSFSPKRRRSYHHEWCIDYEAKIVIINWV